MKERMLIRAILLGFVCILGIVCTQVGFSAEPQLLPKVVRASTRLVGLPIAGSEVQGFNTTSLCFHPALSGIGGRLMSGRVETQGIDGNFIPSDPEGWGALHVDLKNNVAWTLTFPPTAPGTRQECEVWDAFVLNDQSYGIHTVTLNRAEKELSKPKFALWEWNVKSNTVKRIENCVPELGAALGAFDLDRVTLHSREKPGTPWAGHIEVTRKETGKAVEFTLAEEGRDADYFLADEFDPAQWLCRGASSSAFVLFDSRKPSQPIDRILGYDLGRESGTDKPAWIWNEGQINAALGGQLQQIVPIRSLTRATKVLPALTAMTKKPSEESIYKILLLNAVDGSLIKVLDFPSAWPDVMPVLSPDGREIAYANSTSLENVVTLFSLVEGKIVAQKDLLQLDLGYCLPFALRNDGSLLVGDHTAIHAIEPRNGWATKLLFEIVEPEQKPAVPK